MVKHLLQLLCIWAIIYVVFLISATIFCWSFSITVSDRQSFGLMFILSTVSMIVAVEIQRND